MTTPDQLLADSGWRRRHSLYVVWALAFGMGCVSLVYAGGRAKRRDWITWGLVYGVLVVGAFTLVGVTAPDDPTAESSTGQTIGSVAFFAIWVSSTVHVFVTRKEWLRTKAAMQGEARWYEPTESSTAPVASADLGALGLTDPASDYVAPPPRAPSGTPPRRSRPLRAGDATVAPTPPSVARTGGGGNSDRIDLNTATLEEIAELPGVGVAIAHRILGERNRRNGFASVDEAAAALDLPPHLRSRLQQTATVSPIHEGPKNRSPGRVVDL